MQLMLHMLQTMECNSQQELFFRSRKRLNNRFMIRVIHGGFWTLDELWLITYERKLSWCHPKIGATFWLYETFPGNGFFLRLAFSETTLIFAIPNCLDVVQNVVTPYLTVVAIQYSGFCFVTLKGKIILWQPDIIGSITAKNRPESRL